MIQMQTVLPVADNSGAKTVYCIKVMGVGRRRYGLVGDIITCAVRDAIPGAALKHKQVVQAVLVRTKQHIKRKDGSVLSFDENAAVIIDAQNNPRGTRIFGPVARELRDRKFLKITSLSPEVV